MAQQQDLPYVDAVAMAPWWAESTLPIQQGDPRKAYLWHCRNRHTFKTTGIAAYETYLRYGYLICAECEDGGAAIRRY